MVRDFIQAAVAVDSNHAKNKNIEPWKEENTYRHPVYY